MEDELEQSTMLSVHENVIMKPLALYTKKKGGRNLEKIPPKEAIFCTYKISLFCNR